MTTTFNDANNAFYADFMKCVSGEKEESQNAKTCLISDEPLEKYSIRLNCGHSFNYSPLLNAIQQYKNDQFKHGVTEHSMDTHCPYCREKTPGLLPYAPGFNKIKHVNSPCISSFGTNKCVYNITNKKECGMACYYDKCHLHINKLDKVACKGITKAGTPCKNKATPVEHYCKLHRK